MSVRQHGRRVPASRAAFLVAVAAFAVLLPGTLPVRAAPAGDVAVICDREVAPYRALLDAFTKACDCTVRVIAPQDVKPEGLESRLKTEGVGAVLAVGLQAREVVEGLRELPVAIAMVPQAGPWVVAHPNRHGIEMSLSPRRHLETLQRVFPRAKRIGLVFDPAQTGGFVREARTAAAALNLTLETREIVTPGELFRRLEELRGKVDVLWLHPDTTVMQGENLKILLLTSFESHIPLYGFARKYAELGAVAATQFDFAALGGQVAEMIRRVSSKSTVQAPQRWEYVRGAQLVLNQKIARKMGVVLDPDVLEAAADVLR